MSAVILKTFVLINSPIAVRSDTILIRFIREFLPFPVIYRLFFPREICEKHFFVFHIFFYILLRSGGGW